MKSILQKVLVAFGVAFTAAFIVVFITSSIIQNNAESKRAMETEKALTNQLNVILSEPVFSFDKPLIQSIIASFSADKNISQIKVYDQRKQLLGSAGQTDEYSKETKIIKLTYQGNDNIGSIHVNFSSQLSEERVSSAMSSIIIAVLICLALVATFGVLIINRVIVNPLNSVIALLDEIAYGGGDITKRIKYTSSDEIGKLVKGFNFFIGEVQKIISDVAETAMGLEKVSHTVQAAGEVSKNEAATEFQKTEEAMNHLEQLNAATDEIAKNASQTANHTHQAKEISDTSRVVMENNLNQVQDLIKELDNTSEIVGQVHKTSDNISSVLDVIKSIAEQTNLLALNAAIEAARAGESGRGFAVVADEVRALASKTHQSTIEIEEIIASLQNQAAGSVKATSNSKKLADKVIDSTNKASESINNIADKVLLITDMNNMIASASEEQSLVTGDVRNTVKLIHAGAKNLAAEAEHLDETINQLSDLESGLVHKIKQFKY